MATKGMWSYNDVHGIERPKLPQKVSLVSPKMDFDVTGVSVKNVRTHLIDHPRDEGQKQREQLWSFQQKYRGAIGKLRNLPEVQKSELKTTGDSETVDDTVETKLPQSSGSKMSLQSRFRRRFGNRIRKSSKSSDLGADSASSKPKKADDTVEDRDDVKRPGIQRLYSSGFIVKNSLYQQLRGQEISFGKRTKFTDEPGSLEMSSRLGGSLERFPDISTSYQQLPNTSRFRKLSISHYSRRYGDSIHDRRVLSLRRSLTSVTDMDSSRRKLLLVSKRENDGLDCIDSGSENDGEDDNDDEFDAVVEQLDSSRKTLGKFLRISPDSTAEENSKGNSNGDHSVTDTKQESPRGAPVDKKNSYNSNNNTNNTDQPLIRCSNGVRIDEDVSEKSNDNNNKANKNCSKTDGAVSQKDRNVCPEPEIRSLSSASLDIPKDRFGPTTHSIDKKLALRKPWEWRPSPYRWTEKNVRESDKPYIEKILNRGEIIDEFNYDSFARTKPVK